MAEKSPGILETIGIASGLVVLGTAGNEVYKAVRGAEQISSVMSQAKKNIVTPPAQAVTRTLDEAGLTKAMGLYPGDAYRTVSVKDIGGLRTMLENTKVYGMGDKFEHMKFLNEVSEFTKSLTQPYHFNVREFAGKNFGVDMIIGMSNSQTKISFDMLTKGGRYPRTTYGVSYGIARRFINPEAYNAISSGKPFDLSQLSMGYNEWIARHMRQAYTKNIDPNMVIDFAKRFIVTSSIPTMDNPVAKINANTIVPAIFNNETGSFKLLDIINDTDEVRQFMNNFQKLAGDDFSKYTTFINSKAQSTGALIDPAFVNQMFSEYGPDAFDGAKHFAQFFKESTVSPDLMPKTFNAPFVNEMQPSILANAEGNITGIGMNKVKVGNLMNLPTWYDSPEYWKGLIGSETSLLDEILLSGAGTGNILPGASGHEGVIISSKLAKSPLTTYHARNININNDLSKVGIESLMNKYTSEILRYSRRNQTATLPSNMAEHMRNVLLTAEELAEFNNVLGVQGRDNYSKAISSLDTDRLRSFQEMRNKLWTRMTTVNQSGTTQAKQFLHAIGGLDFKGGINDTEFGTIRMGKYGKEKIFDIVGGGREQGFRLETRSRTPLGSSFKNWFTRKQIRSQTIRDHKRLFKTVYGLQAEIYGASDPTSKAQEIFGMLRDYDNNRKSIKSIVNRWAPSIDKRLLDSSHKIIYSSEHIRKLDPTIIDLNLREAYAQLGIEGPSLSGLPMEQKIRGHRSFISNLINSAATTEQKTALQIMFNPYLGNASGQITPGLQAGAIYSNSGASVMAGIGVEDINMNIDTALKLKQFGMHSLHDEIVSNFNFNEFANIINAYEPMATKALPRGSAVIDLKYVTPKDIDRLFPNITAQQDIDEVRNLAAELFKKGSTRTVSDKTRYFIKVSEDITIPILDFHSKSYIGIMNQLDDTVESQSVAKLLTRSSKKLLHAGLSGDPSRINLASAELTTNVGRIMGNTKAFTKQPMGGMALENRPGIFDDDFLNRMRSAAEKKGNLAEFDALMNEYNLVGHEKTRLAMVSESDFNKLVTQSADFQEAVTKFKTNNPQFTKGQLNKFTTQYLTDIRKSKIYGFGGRDPIGYGAFQLVEGESFLRRTYALAGQKPGIENRILSGGIYGNRGFINLTASDFDQDRIALAIARSNPQTVKEIEAFLAKTGTYAMDLFDKGGIKAVYDKKLKSVDDILSIIDKRVKGGAIEELDQVMASQFSVGQLSNRLADMRGYGLTAEADAIFLTDVLREKSIGGKGKEGVEAARSFLDTVFNNQATSSAGFKKRIDALKNIVTTTDAFQIKGKNYFTEKYQGEQLDEFLGKLLKGYDDYTHTSAGQLAHMARRAKWQETIHLGDLRQIINTAFESPASGNYNADLISEAVRGNKNKVRLGMNKMQGAFEIAGSRILKNKAVLAAAGVGLATYLLRSSDSQVKHQDVREQSIPKRKSLMGGEAINPPSGSVYQPSSVGYNFQVRGNLPRNVDQRQFRHQMSMLGIPIGGRITNRDRSIDTQYVNDLHKDNDSLLWNYK